MFFPKRATSSIIIVAVYSASAFAPAPPVRRGHWSAPSSTALEIFGKAFANDASLGKRENAGLKKVRMLAGHH